MTRQTETTPLTDQQQHEADNKISLLCKGVTLVLTSGAIGMVVYGATWKESPLLGGPDCSNSAILGQYEPCDTTLSCDTVGNTASWLGFSQSQLLTICLANMCTLSNAHQFWTWATGSNKGLKTSCPDHTIGPMIASVVGAAILLTILATGFKILCSKTTSQSPTSNAGNQQRLLPSPHPISVVTSQTDNRHEPETPKTEPHFTAQN